MKNTLELLDVDGNYTFTGLRLSQKGISKLKLREINLSSSVEEINLDHMKDTLVSLKTYNPIDLSELKLKKLHISKPTQLVKNISLNHSHMNKSLEFLIIEKSKYINQYINMNDIHTLNLKYLIVTDPTINMNLQKKTIFIKCSKNELNKMIEKISKLLSIR